MTFRFTAEDRNPEADRQLLERGAPGLSAAPILEALLPDVTIRETCLNLFADAIVQAHQLRPNGWSVSLFPNLVRLNVGKIRAHDIFANEVHLVLATDALNEQAKAAIQNHTETLPNLYDSLPGTTDARFAAGELSNLLPFVRDAHLQIVTRAARVLKNRTSFYKSHSPDVLAYLRNFLGRDELPDPDYQGIPPVPGSGQMTRGPMPSVNVGAALAARLTHGGLHFTPWQRATFYTALQTKGFVILSGISGTGKTRLAQAFAGMLPQPAEGANHLFVPVRPDWRDSKSLLGYYNPLTGTYEWTPFLRFLLRVVQSYEARDSLAWFVILDEMNLAHVEYYFADLLSVLESGRDGDGWTREPLRLGYPDDAAGDLPPRDLRLPPNLYIVGTVNPRCSTEPSHSN